MVRKNYSRKRRKQMVGGAAFTQDQINELVAMGFDTIFPASNYADKFNNFKNSIENVIYWYIIYSNNGIFTEDEKRNVPADRIVDMLYNKYFFLENAKNTLANSKTKHNLEVAINTAKDRLVGSLSGTQIYTFDKDGRIVGPAIGFMPYKMGGGKKRRNKTRRRYKK